MQRRSGGGGGRLGAALFTDIVGSTAIAAEMGNRRWAELVARHHQIVRRELRRFGGKENDTAGDGFFVTFERPAEAIRCAVAVAQAVRSLGIEIRAGMTFGELEQAGPKASGLVVNTAARVMSVAGPGEILVPASVREIVSGAGISFADHGTYRLKGLEDEARLFRVTAVEGEEVAPPLATDEADERRREIFPGPNRGRGRVIVGAIAAAAIIAAIAWFARGGSAPPETTDERSQTFLVELDPEGGSERQRIDIVRPSRSGAHPETPRWIVAGQGAVWVLSPGFEGPTLMHVDPEHADARDPVAIQQPAFHLTMVAGFDALWLAAADRLVRISASTDRQQVVVRIRYREGQDGDASLTADQDHLWIGRTDGFVMRVLPSGEVVERKVFDSINLIAAGEGGVCVVDQVGGLVARVDPDSLETLWEAPASGTVSRIAVDGDYVWLLDQSSGVVTRLSSSSGADAGQASIGPGATDLALGLGAVWVSHSDGAISRIDQLTRQVTPGFATVEGTASAIAVDRQRGSLWVDVGPLHDAAD
jgi:class 3 adenylate cyclase